MISTPNEMWSHVQSVDVHLVLGTWYDFAIEYIENRIEYIETLQALFSLIFVVVVVVVQRWFLFNGAESLCSP